MRRPGAAFVVVTVVLTAIPLTQQAAADGSPPAPTEPAPWCQRDQDLACTLVRETPAGLWIWTERFRPADPGNSGWTLAVGAGPASPVPVAVTHFVPAAPPPPRPTPNGAPILE